jgi:hypothetical protein
MSAAYPIQERSFKIGMPVIVVTLQHAQLIPRVTQAEGPMVVPGYA